MTFSNATVKDLVLKGILEENSDLTRGSSILTSAENVTVLINFEESLRIITSTTNRHNDFKVICHIMSLLVETQVNTHVQNLVLWGTVGSNG